MPDHHPTIEESIESLFIDVYSHPERTSEQIAKDIERARRYALVERHGISAERVEEIRLRVLEQMKKI